MGKIGAFLNLNRVEAPERPPSERVGDFREFVGTLPLVELREQASRCMECGVPFCHHGCPVGNLIPDWNDLVYRDRWQEALEQLHRTNNFPEFTGRLCPAPCEAACVLEINEGNAVSIKQVELAIVNRGWDEGWVVPQPAVRQTGRSVAVVGSGPAGLACAQQLARGGEHVIVYERDEAAGGLVRFGVPEFKIEKRLVERRVQQLAGGRCRVSLRRRRRERRHRRRAEGSPRCGCRRNRLAGAARSAGARSRARRRSLRDGVPLRPRAFDRRFAAANGLTAAGKHVVVIGGGDTGADCVAHANREAAASVTQIELLGEPPPSRPDDVTPWPRWPMKLRMSYALKEGGDRSFAISTTRFTGEDGRVEAIHWQENSGVPPFDLVAGTEESHPAELVLLAMGFLGPEHGLLDQLQVERDARGNAAAPRYLTSADGVFAAGDARRGQSLIVWAINEGRQCAQAVQEWLDGEHGAKRPDAFVSIAMGRPAE